MSTIDSNSAILRAANAGDLLEGFQQMPRRRFQRGSVVLRGGSWEFRWRDDVIDNGKLKRICRSEVFAEKKKYPTKKLAWRDSFVVQKQHEINSPTHRALHRSNFHEFAERWAKEVLVNLEPSTQAGVRSHLGTAQKDPNRKAKRKLASLVECLGNLEMKDITTEILQSLVTSYHKQGAAPKTVKNIVVSLRMLWTQAKAWGYVTHDPFPGLVLPDAEPVDVPYYRAAQMTSVIEIAQEPYRTLFWLTGETGIRRGEVCALRVQDVILERDGKPLEQAIVVVQRKVWNGIIGRPKSKRPRVFVLSPQLTEHPVTFVVPIQAQPDHLLFTNSKGGLLHPDNLVKRHLKPVLVKAGIKQGGMHAFRHGNATMMDRLNVPMKIRQDRLGHIDARTTMGYTHAVSDDEKRAAAQMGEILCANARKAEKTNAFAGCEGLPVQ